jgi:AcrR family transcriptional regulator
MTTTKHELKKQEIIATAFKVWGEDHFFKTSLETVAKAMGMSKAALYRYFSGKEELLREMTEELYRIHQRACENVQNEGRGKNFLDRLETYHGGFLKFYAENHWYYRFTFLYLLPHSQEDMVRSEKLEELQAEIFPGSVIEQELGWAPEMTGLVKRFIFSVGMFLLHHRSFGLRLSVEVKELVELNRCLVTKGSAGEKSEGLVDFEKIEQLCRVRPEELPEPIPVFQAIGEVVAEEGLWGASLEKIARRAGMSKSSLYFYFTNRDDMLWEIINRERHRLGEIFLERTGGIEGFEERLYGYFAVFASYLGQRENFLSVMNWFRFQRFQIKPPSDMGEGMDRYMKFLEEGVEDRRLRRDLLDPVMMIQWINFLVIQEIHHTLCTGGRPGQDWTRIRALYMLFLYGTGGFHEKK